MYKNGYNQQIFSWLLTTQFQNSTSNYENKHSVHLKMVWGEKQIKEKEKNQVLIARPLYCPLRTTKSSGGWNSSNQVTSVMVTPSNSRVPSM